MIVALGGIHAEHLVALDGLAFVSVASMIVFASDLFAEFLQYRRNSETREVT